MTEELKPTRSDGADAGETQVQPPIQRSEEQVRILDKEGEDFKKSIEEIEVLVHRGRADSILHRHVLGRKLSQIESAEVEATGRSYGAGAVKKIARYFDWSESYVRATLALAKGFEAEEVRAICSEKRQGNPFSMAHMLAFALVEDREERRRLVEKAADECLTAKAVRDLIAKERPEGGCEDGRGARFRSPKNAPELVRQLGGFVGTALKRHKQVWAKEDCSLPTLVDRLSKSARKSPDLKARLNRLAADLKELREVSEWLVAKAEEAVAKLEPRAESPDEKAAEVAAVGG